MADGIAAASVTTFLNDFASAAQFVQLHTDDPGADGSANISSTNTREAITWAGPTAAGVLSSSSSPAWPAWAGTSPETVKNISFWDQATDGNFAGSMTLSPQQTMNSGDTLTVSGISVTIAPAS